MVSLVNFSSIFPGGGQLTPFAHLCGRPCSIYSVRADLYIPTTDWRRGVVVSGVRRMNEVNARRAYLKVVALSAAWGRGW